MIDITKLSITELKASIKETTKQLCQDCELSAHLVDLKIRELQTLQEELNNRGKESEHD